MTTRILDISNKKTLNFLINKLSGYTSLSFPPATGLVTGNISELLIQHLNDISVESSSVKILYNTDHSKCYIFFKTIEEFSSFKQKLERSSSTNIFSEILQSINNHCSYDDKVYHISEKTYKYNQPLIMGILNVTPDSFSDGGKFYDSASAIDKAFNLIADGAEIIDVGGESTRPGADAVSLSEELKRVIPVIEAIKKNSNQVLISIDTTKSQVAQAALELGVDIINDISGLTFDEKIAELAAVNNAALIIMHIKGDPRNMQVNPVYSDLLADIYDRLFNQIQFAEQVGVKDIIIDPGIGFGKTVDDNFELLSRIEEFKSLGCPLMIGVSRKSFLGKTFDLNINERDVATVITEAIMLTKGASIIRTHNVKYAKQLLTIYKNVN